MLKLSSLYRLVLLCSSIFFARINAAAQQPADTAGKITIRILSARVINYNKTDSGEFHKFIDSVAFLEGTDTLYCDSAYQNTTTKNFEAFGDVKISQQDGTNGTCDYLRYTADKKLAFMQGNVILTDGNNHLRCEELTYDLGTKTAEYFKWGTLKSDSTSVTSKTGIYNIHTKEARFKEDVLVMDRRYKITSGDLGYNTETKLETFYAHSVVVSDSGKSVLETSSGTYDSKHVIARFTGHSSIWNDGEYIEADSMHYNKVTGYGYAIGHVISLDTAHHSKLKCGYAVYFRKQRILWAMIKPVMEQVNGKDTIYMRADTFYTAPMVKMEIPRPKIQIPDANDSNTTSENVKNKNQIPNPKGDKPRADTNFTWVLPHYKYRIPDFMSDTSRAKPVRIATDTHREQAPPAVNTGKKGKKGKVNVPKLKTADTSAADTTAPMYFVGYNHVLIFADSMQGKCDSVCYTRSDSTIRLIVTPILWAHKSQITGDTILLYLDSNQLRKMYVPNNAFLVSQSGPEKAHFFDQVQGRTLTGYFRDNTITNMVVSPNAECIYYATDKDKAYMGVDEATSTKMRIFFAEQKITNIKFTQDVHHTITPMEKADFANMKLSRFKWLMEQRPKTKEELFK